MATLIVQVHEDRRDQALVGFPFREGQYIEDEVDNDGIVHVYITSEREFDDTTVGQEQFLNASAAVIKYEVRA